MTGTVFCNARHSGWRNARFRPLRVYPTPEKMRRNAPVRAPTLCMHGKCLVRHTLLIAAEAPVRFHQGGVAMRECVHLPGGIEQVKVCRPRTNSLHRQQFGAGRVHICRLDAGEIQRALRDGVGEFDPEADL